ncbi:unnamed protein product [Aphanomyces euteiches]
MAAAGDITPEKSHIARYLCLLPPRFANTVMFITRESPNSSKYANMHTILAELKLDDERQQMHNPSLRKLTGRTGDALNATSNNTCHYCNKIVHFRYECRRRLLDEAREQTGDLVDEDEAETTSVPAGAGKIKATKLTTMKLDNEDLFMVEDYFHSTNCQGYDSLRQSNSSLHEVPDMDDETNESNESTVPYKTEAIIDSGATAHMTGNVSLLHSISKCSRGVQLADGHPIPVTMMGDLKIK